MINELIQTHFINTTSFMNPFTIIKDSFDHAIPLDARKLRRIEIQLIISRTTRIFNIRCQANNVKPKTLINQMEWK